LQAKVRAEEKLRVEAELKAMAGEKARIESENIARAEEKARIEMEARAAAEELARAEADARARAEKEARIEEETRAQIGAEERTRAAAAAKEAAKAEKIAEKKAQAEMKAKAKAEAKAEAEEKVKAEAKARAEIFMAARLAETKETRDEPKAAVVTIGSSIESVWKKCKEKLPTLLPRTLEEPPKEDKETEGKRQAVSEAICKTVQSAAIASVEMALPFIAKELHGKDGSAVSKICAKDIMQTDIVWGSAEYSVQQAIEAMQRHDTNYMVVGRNGVVEGIVSKSDLSGAISPYLRPEFAKWRRPLDDATLQIRIKWIMSRQVHTIKPETPLTVVMEDMRRLGRRAMPVADRQGKVQGLVTVFDIFKALLKNNSQEAAATPQTQSSEQDSNLVDETISEQLPLSPV